MIGLYTFNSSIDIIMTSLMWAHFACNSYLTDSILIFIDIDATSIEVL